MKLLKRKIDDFLKNWKEDKERPPLVVSGARQVGKTSSILSFAEKNYQNVVAINFALEKQYRDIFETGYSVDKIIENISFLDSSKTFPPNKTLFFFDEIQACPAVATSLKAFKLDGRYDVICSGSMMGINYQEIESNSVGFKTDYEMSSMDFEEFLWAKGYSQSQIEVLYQAMKRGESLPKAIFEAMLGAFREYMVLGGMPRIVNSFVRNGNYSGTLEMQRQILKDYEEDITKYAGGLDKGRILNVYRKIPVFLGKDNKKFQISKVSHGARNREYIGVVDWLVKAGIVNVCHVMADLSLPLKGNYNPDYYKLYFADPGPLVASLDDEAQSDLRANKNFNTYKGALYENVVADMLRKGGYDLYFYANEKKTIKLDFLVRDKDSLVPIEVKASDGKATSMKKAIESTQYPDIHYGIKLCNKNIGFDGACYTFPYFLTFLLKRFWQKEASQDFRIYKANSRQFGTQEPRIRFRGIPEAVGINVRWHNNERIMSRCGGVPVYNRFSVRSLTIVQCSTIGVRYTLKVDNVF